MNTPIFNSGLPKMLHNTEVAIFAGGCFWCTEAFFLELNGVESVLSGYTGGTTIHPTYEEICSGETGHAEAIRIEFNPQIISYVELLEFYFDTHDPTTLNRQGNDVGSQYRSNIFYTNNIQKECTDKYIALLNTNKTFLNKVVTKVTSECKFFEAEEYHQNYYELNKSKGYCSLVITPKIEKFKIKYLTKLKSNLQLNN